MGQQVWEICTLTQSVYFYFFNEIRIIFYEIRRIIILNKRIMTIKTNFKKIVFQRLIQMFIDINK